MVYTSKCIEIVQEDGKYIYNVTGRHVRVTIVAVEKVVKHFCVYYPACKLRIFCYVWLYHILPHCLINGTNFEKKFVGH